MIEITDSFEKGEWDAFVLSHPKGNIFQSTMIADVFNRTKNYESISLMAIDEDDGEVLAVLQSAIISEMQGLLSKFSSRSVIQGGPLFKDSQKGLEAVVSLLKHYNTLVGGSIVYTQIRNMWDTSDSRQRLDSLGFEYDQHLDFLIDLDRKEDEIWSGIHKSRRKGINRAEKNGIVVRKVENSDEVCACYELVLETYRRFKIPIADISLFETAYDSLVSKGHADFFIALKDNKAIGTRITLNYKDIVYDWYAGSKQGVDYVDEALVWQILKENAGKYKVFDFGGAGHPDKPYGVREFKRRFGGEMVNFGRYEKVHSATRKKVAMVGLKCIKSLS
ncbi:peptidoglycan bridge formation glycyltransferase FemA/FemB family protein [Methanolobus sediminis]|uniref:Peptidoglycan bridge formation glycyltransferase FemA/FemB family protein n=1 Tax=Methanolobus sediminis TaxID=3072978 RepID=A0AA51YLX9_9EURY|nr:peptidoglycan bridge formation glycyltransferase FemA/FemB family protein [Methanolobus sediminis]WMW25439.1 peptidoglycan bridge formation glycyltransferase FemA/FemB family protein [Methanolobus sediminis]